MKKRNVPIILTQKKREHYLQLGNWLKLHPEIQHRKLHQGGFQIDIRTVPKELEQEFLEIVTFNEK